MLARCVGPLPAHRRGLCPRTHAQRDSPPKHAHDAHSDVRPPARTRSRRLAPAAGRPPPQLLSVHARDPAHPSRAAARATASDSPSQLGNPCQLAHLPRRRRPAAPLALPALAPPKAVSVTTPIPFAPNNVKLFFTLFPKCFSSFVHTTCSLSALAPYLALEEEHLPVCTALPNCTTPRPPPHPLERGRHGRSTRTGR